MVALRTILKLCCAMLFALTLASCSKNSISWKEDVQLQDGRVITVDRYAELTGRVEPTGQTPPPTYYTIKFKHPDTGEDVFWEGFVRSNKEEARKSFASDDHSQDKLKFTHPHIIAKTLMMKDGKLFIVGTMFDMQMLSYGCPNPPYILFEWVNGNWIERPLEEIPYKKFLFNLNWVGLNLDKRDSPTGRIPYQFAQKTDTMIGGDVKQVLAEIDLTKMIKQTFGYEFYEKKGLRCESPSLWISSH